MVKRAVVTAGTGGMAAHTVLPEPLGRLPQALHSVAEMLTPDVSKTGTCCGFHPASGSRGGEAARHHHAQNPNCIYLPVVSFGPSTP